MKKDKHEKPADNQPQKGLETKEGLPEKTPATDSSKNSASQMPGLNEEKITRQDTFPSDGDNLTN